jgi:Circularly permutated YpsA SLOG family
MHHIFKNIKLISGGQTGVDRSILDYALEKNIQIGGWCPFGRIAEDGSIDQKYNLKETNTRLYIHRTYLNVRDADATVILFFDKLDKGAEYTKSFCIHFKKPCKIYDLRKIQNAKIVFEWIKENNFKTINFAGSRESNSPGIYIKTMQFLKENI